MTPESTRAIVIGTGVTVPHVLRQITLTADPPRVIGAILPPGVTDTTTLEKVMPPRLGDFDDLADVLARETVDLVLCSLPMSMHEQIRTLTQALNAANVNWRFLPTLNDQLTGAAAVGPRGVTIQAASAEPAPGDVAALLARTPRPLDEAAIARSLSERAVLITGAGGSIGSELARQVARFGPARLILVERSENALFEIDREIAARFPDLTRAAILHDVTDASRTRDMVGRHRPDVIFHAAAHKHVPMMEDHPAEAVENNFYGTRSIADAALEHNVERFVMISTDKAVNPTSVMGATKRLAELYIQSIAGRGRTRFSMVRFGNVLGSACSVLPIWTRQLAQGGPITVTHPDMTRYFMTIPEAAALVMQSAAFDDGPRLTSTDEGRLTSHSGDIFVLDMDRPIRIRDLAERFLRMHGLEPNIEVPIVFTGARPGEKLHEQLHYDAEDMHPTAHASIRMLRSPPPDPARIARITETFNRLRHPSGPSAHAWDMASPQAIVHALRNAVPEMVRALAG